MGNLLVAASEPRFSDGRRFSLASTGQSMIVSWFDLKAARSAGTSSSADSMRIPFAPKLSAYFMRSGLLKSTKAGRWNCCICFQRIKP